MTAALQTAVLRNHHDVNTVALVSVGHCGAVLPERSPALRVLCSHGDKHLTCAAPAQPLNRLVSAQEMQADRARLLQLISAAPMLVRAGGQARGRLQRGVAVGLCRRLF